MHKVLHLIGFLDRLYVSKKGGRKLARIEDYIDKTKWKLHKK